MERELLTAQELADVLNLSVETIWRYTRENRIPVVPLGKRQYRYNKNKVLQALTQTQAQTAIVQESEKHYTAARRLTYDDYANLPEEPGYRYELIDGFLIKEPSPIIHHQRVSRRLQRILEDHFAEVNPLGEVFGAPLDVILSKYTTVQPDLVYVSNIKDLANAQFIEIVPALAVEILSPSSTRKDRVQKLDLYRRHGVSHYWIVDPGDGIMEAYKLQNESYVLVAATDGDFEHPDFVGLSFNVSKLCLEPGA